MLRTAYSLLLLTGFLWATNAVSGKLALGHVSPMMLNGLRWPVAFAVVLALGWRQIRRDLPALSRRDVLVFAALGAVGFSIFNGLIYSALQYTSAINASIEQAAMPLVVFLVNFLLFSLRVSWAQMVGFTLSAAGVLLTASHGDLSQLAELDVNFGDALMVGAVVLYGCYTVALRFKPNFSWQTAMLIMAAGAMVASVPTMAWEHAAGATILPDARGWALVVYTAMFPGLLAQISYLRGIEIIGSNRAGLFVNLVPIFGTVLAVLVIGEAFRLYHAIAMVLVLGGIWLAENSGRKMGPGR